LGLSTFVLGIALGPFWSPLAEFYGRRPIYLCSFAGFIIWLVPSAVAKNIETMIVARFFQGLAGSAFLSVSGGTVGDLFTRDTMLAPMAIFALAPFVGPSTGPLVGGLINTYINWRWTHYVLLIWASILLLTIALFVPETYRGCFCFASADARGKMLTWAVRSGAAEKKGTKTPEDDRRRQVARAS
jgi:multidrug resistance protein